ncbi:MAG: ROK family protein [Ignavibacteriales bacterium]|nr:ROK family protein [Ignavibacteriales bacterium]
MNQHRASNAIGIDLGGTTVKAGLVSESGELIHQTKLPSLAEMGPDAVIGQIEKAAREIVRANPSVSVRAMGIGAPGVVDNNGFVKAPPNLKGWSAVPLAAELRKRFDGFRIEVENDANAAAIAEAKFGAGRNHPDFLFVIWGTGVGGGIILNHTLFRGPTGGAGEIGHVTIDRNGPDCNCGNRGCVEAYVGQRYLSQRAMEKLLKHPESSVHALVNSDLAKVEPLFLSQAAQAGDATARDILWESGSLLGIALASVMNIMDLRVSIIGGGISAAGDFVLQAVKESVVAHVLAPLRPDIQVLQAQLGNNAGMLGAAGLVL